MGIVRGKDVLLRLDDGAGGYRVLGGLRAKSLSLNAGAVEATTVDSNGWRELLACGGVRQASVSGNGVFINDAAAQQAQALFFSGEHGQWELKAPGYGSLKGPFQITALEYAGNFRGEAAFRLSLASAGEITFTPEGG